MNVKKTHNTPKCTGSKDIAADNELKELCRIFMTERYGDNAPHQVTERLTQELEIITRNGHSRAYLLAYKVTSECSRLFAPYILKGSAGASLVAFVLRITHTDPLPMHLYCSMCGFIDFEVDKYYDGDGGENESDHCGFDLLKRTCPKCGDEFEGDGHNIPFEIFAGLNGEKAPHFENNVPEELYDDINGFLQDLLSEEELK